MGRLYDELFTRYPILENCREDIEKALQLLVDCYKADGTVLVCGNGGSAADSEHIVGELMKGFILKRELTDKEKSMFGTVDGGECIAEKLQRPLRAISLVSQSGLISAFANDVDAKNVFAQQVFAYAQKPQDVLIALSTSGNSNNVVNAAKTAKATGIVSIGITGESGGKLNEICTVCLRLPANEPYSVQELTLPLYHALCAEIEEVFFG